MHYIGGPFPTILYLTLQLAGYLFLRVVYPNHNTFILLTIDTVKEDNNELCFMATGNIQPLICLIYAVWD